MIIAQEFIPGIRNGHIHKSPVRTNEFFFFFIIFKQKTMKTQVIALGMTACCFMFAVDLFSQAVSSAKSEPLSYVESSAGLANPEWEGGRTELEFADINQDGHIDIITIGDHGSPYINSGETGIMVYFGDGFGNWNVQMSGDFGYGGIAAGDANNDGYMDVGYAMHHNYSSTDFGDQLIEVALGDGSGAVWAPWDDGLATNGEDWGMFSTDFGDVDNDGDLDLGSISFGCCAGIHIYINNMNGTWTQSFGILNGNSDMIFQFGDINNDGYLDFIAGYEYGTCYFGDGEGGFTLNDQNLPPGGLVGRYGPSIGDVDNDGDLDLAFVNGNGGLHVYTWNGDLEQWDDWSGNLPASGPYEQSQLADMDMDGYIDLVVYGTGTVTLYLGDGNGNWSSDATFTVGDPGYAQAFRVGGDIDKNGRPDMVLLEEEGDWISYQNHLKCFKESSIAFLLSIRPVFPRGHELLRPNSIRFIDWISTVPGNEESLVKLEYSVTGPEGPWNLIAQNLPDNGRYQWLVPQENSADCYIRYTVTSVVTTYSSITPAAFTITDGTIGVAELGVGTDDFLIYPNPAAKKLTVDYQQSAVSGQQSAVSSQQSAVSGQQSNNGIRRVINKVTISDYFGREIKAFENISSFPFQIDIADLQEGLYVMKIKDDDGRTANLKFLKISD